jgi:hypothetical protein
MQTKVYYNYIYSFYTLQVFPQYMDIKVCLFFSETNKHIKRAAALMKNHLKYRIIQQLYIYILYDSSLIATAHIILIMPTAFKTTVISSIVTY